MSYTTATIIVPADQYEDFQALVSSLGIEGATPELASVPLVPAEGPESPASHYLGTGWVHVDLLDLLPEGIVQPPPEPDPEPAP